MFRFFKKKKDPIKEISNLLFKKKDTKDSLINYLKEIVPNVQPDGLLSMATRGYSRYFVMALSGNMPSSTAEVDEILKTHFSLYVNIPDDKLRQIQYLYQEATYYNLIDNPVTSFEEWHDNYDEMLKKYVLK